MQGEKQQFINSCFNYTGGKYRLLPQIYPHFPNKYENFVDLFCGGGTVGINSLPKKQIVLNDSQSQVIEWFEVLRNHSFEEVTRKLEAIINTFNLSDTYRKGYEFYGAESSKGLVQFNKKGYLKMRAFYNTMDSTVDKPFFFYLLTVYGFNNQIRFNKKGEFNLPVGKRDFNKSMRTKLYHFQQALASKSVVTFDLDFESLTLKKEDFVYVDPPYLITTASYNENGLWNPSEEKRLLTYLDTLNHQGNKFALSNVLEHKGRVNEILEEWSKKYKIIDLDYQYNNSNYQSKNIEKRTREVLIVNY